jgi:acetyltransferase-like isoleucine patch superfamily enzyme
MHRMVFDLLNVVQAVGFMPRRWRRIIVRWMGVEIHPSVTLRQNIFIGSSRLHHAANAYMNVGCFIDGSDDVYLGERVHFAPGVMVLTSAHEIGPPKHRAGAQTTGPVKIGNGCWIGARAVVFPGVTIGAGCVIGAGAVVRKDCDPNGAYAGIPAVRISELNKQ